MRSTRTSAAWAALAITTSLLGMALVSAQPQTSVATSGIAGGVTAHTNPTHAQGDVNFGKQPEIVDGVYDIAVVLRP